MFAILHALGMFVADMFKSRSGLEAENLCRRGPLISCLRFWSWATAGDSAVVRSNTASDG